MRRLTAAIVALIAATTSTVSAGHVASHAATTEAWIIDSDMGTDDWVAMLYVSNVIGRNVLALTVSGNGLARCGAAGGNVTRILKMDDRVVPIGCSNRTPLDGTHSYPIQWRDETDTLLDLQVPNAKAPKPQNAMALLERTLRGAKEPVSILSMGAMSNIAQVISENPALKQKIRRIVAMTGAVDVPGNVRVPGFTEDSPNAVAEWNAFIDPVAAKIVFDSDVPLEIVPLDATNKAPLTDSFIERFTNQATGADGRFVSKIFRKVKNSNPAGEYYHWDPLAAVIAMNPDICERRDRRRLTVVAEVAGLSSDSGFPSRNWLGAPRNVLVEETAGDLTTSGAKREVTVCLQPDVARFEQTMIDAFAPAKY